MEHSKQTIRQVISVNKKVYAVGLFWQPLAVNGRKEQFLIQQTARSLVGGAQFYCVKSARPMQFALGFSAKGHQKNQLVAAGAVANALKDKPSSLCVFKVNEGWWMVVIRNGLILPEDDFLFEKEDDAKKAYQKLFSLPDWGHKIAPKDWHLTGTVEKRIEDIFENYPAMRLQDFSATSYRKFLIFFTLVLVIGLYLFQDTLFKLFFPPPPMPQRPVVRMKPSFVPTKTTPSLDNKTVATTPPKIIKKSVRLEPVPAPWTKIQSPMEFANACELAVKFFNKPVPGWELSNVVCDPIEIKAEFKRKERGILAMILKASDTFFKSTVFNIEKRGDRAIASLKMVPLSIESQPPVEKKDVIINRFMNFSQRTGFEIKTSSVKDSIKHPKNVNLLTHFSFVKFSFSSKIDIKEWANMLHTLGSIEWREIKWNHVKKMWEVEGRVYEKI